MSGSMAAVLASSYHWRPGLISPWGKIFSPSWIAPAVIPEREENIQPFNFHGWVPVGEVKLFCTTLSSKKWRWLGYGRVLSARVEGGGYWGEVGAVHLSCQKNRLKVQERGLWCRVMLVDCCGWVVNQDGVLYWNPLQNSSV